MSRAARKDDCSRGALRPRSRVHHTCSGAECCQHFPRKNTASWQGAWPWTTAQCAQPFQTRIRVLPGQTPPTRKGLAMQQTAAWHRLLQHIGKLRCTLKDMLGPTIQPKCSGADGIAWRPSQRFRKQSRPHGTCLDVCTVRSQINLTAVLISRASHLLAGGSAPVAEVAARAAACLRLHVAGHWCHGQGPTESQVPRRRRLWEVMHPLAACREGCPSAQLCSVLQCLRCACGHLHTWKDRFQQYRWEVQVSTWPDLTKHTCTLYNIMVQIKHCQACRPGDAAMAASTAYCREPWVRCSHNLSMSGRTT